MKPPGYVRSLPTWHSLRDEPYRPKSGRCAPLRTGPAAARTARVALPRENFRPNACRSYEHGSDRDDGVDGDVVARTQTVVSNLVKALEQEVVQKAAQELDRIERALATIWGGERNAACVHSEYPRAGDAHAMGVATEMEKGHVKRRYRLCRFGVSATCRSYTRHVAPTTSRSPRRGVNPARPCEGRRWRVTTSFIRGSEARHLRRADTASTGVTMLEKNFVDGAVTMSDEELEQVAGGAGLGDALVRYADDLIGGALKNFETSTKAVARFFL